jgi:hypothetical protein
MGGVIVFAKLEELHSDGLQDKNVLLMSEYLVEECLNGVCALFVHNQITEIILYGC